MYHISLFETTTTFGWTQSYLPATEVLKSQGWVKPWEQYDITFVICTFYHVVLFHIIHVLHRRKLQCLPLTHSALWAGSSPGPESCPAARRPSSAAGRARRTWWRIWRWAKHEKNVHIFMEIMSNALVDIPGNSETYCRQMCKFLWVLFWHRHAEIYVWSSQRLYSMGAFGEGRHHRRPPPPLLQKIPSFG